MDILSYILLFTFLGSIVSLIGGIILLAREKFAIRIAHFLASFAAGVMLGVSFVDLIPEALELSEELGIEVNIFLWVLAGILGFFLLERSIHWFHHHHEHNLRVEKEEKTSVVPLIVLGDSLHNFIDGAVIAATFLVDIRLGMVTTLAVAAHEIPQEIGDCGLLLHRGLKRVKVLTINILSSLTAFLGAILTFVLGDKIEGILPILISLAAGFFIYISLSDLVPEIHGEDRRDVAFWETVMLLIGVFVIWIAVSYLENNLAAH